MTDIIKDIEGAAEAGIDVRTKLIIGLGAALTITGAAIFGANHFENKGRDLERATWLSKQVQWDQARAKLVADNDAKIASVIANNEAIERETSEKHEQELAQLRRERDADRAAVDRNGGLRISAAACTGAGTAPAGTETASTVGRDEPSAGTIRIPQPVEDGLWSIVDDADEVSAQLRACQGWIRENGFYGPSGSKTKNLPDRIPADQEFQEQTP